MSLILILGFLALSSGVLLFYLLRPLQRSAPVKSDPISTPPSSGPQGSVVVKHEMVAIPGGTFKMGRDDGPRQERPSHNVTVRDFLLDNTEVTTDEYAMFVKETNHPLPDHWGGMPGPEQGQWPVTNVTFHDAEVFALWRSKRDGVSYRLPTEEEWEYAARNGAQVTLYPWGNEWMDDRAAIKRPMPLPVGSFPKGANRWGVVDLIGNVWEWTSSKASTYEGGRELPITARDWMVIRGGSYLSNPSNPEMPISGTYREWVPPTLKHSALGFRLARSVQ